MTQFWWVNHKQTARQEIENQYLWSPKTRSDGTRTIFYDNMREASPGDLVLSYANQQIKYVGRVVEFAFTAPKPTEFGTTGTYWNQEGWLLPVFWTELVPAVRPKDLLAILSPLLPLKYSPIRPSTGDGNQGVYLAGISEAVGLGEFVWNQFGFSEAPTKWQTEKFAAAQCEYLNYHRTENYVT